MCMSVSICVYMPQYLCVYACVSLFLSVSMSVSMCMLASVFVRLCLCLCLCSRVVLLPALSLALSPIAFAKLAVKMLQAQCSQNKYVYRQISLLSWSVPARSEGRRAL